MAITLAADGSSVVLPEDLLWEDEFAWSPVAQTVERSVTGALIVQAAARTAGRPITLRPEDERSAWCSRLTLAQLMAWAAIPGKVMTLTLRGTSRSVIFRHAVDEGGNGSATEAKPVVHYNDAQDGDFYLATLRFMEV